ncbi:MAG TPA: serine/threonine-protein kinase, partial [Myxococcaceae bacterium]|nr:serine/threonine-protein kinase [Myxococcaceae bacterium]
MQSDRPPGIDAPTELNPSPLMHGTEPLAVPPPTGQQLESGTLLEGRFRIVRMLGRGGMGEVYEAVDLALGARVALKTVRLEQAANERALHRFRREILLARKIAHPNVCKVFELHVGGPGEPPVFLSMELLEGETLADRLRREGRLDEDVARGLVLQVASALGAAHAEGVVHRDLKASNVMLVPVQGGGDRAVVTDFGIAHAAGAFSDATTTWEGPLGTPAYMAPEQVTGGAVTPATDLYCLGVLMYELTTGSLPFTGGSPAEVAHRRLDAEPPDPRDSTPGLSKRWSELVRWCLAKDPTQRPQTAEALRRALEGKARPYRRLSRRRLVALGLVAALALAVVPLVAKLRPPRTPAVAAVRPVVAVLEAANLTGDGDLDWLSTALPEALASSLEPIRGLRLVPPRVVAERQFSLGVATAPALGRLDGPRRIADSVGAEHLIVLTFKRDKPGSLRFEALVRSGSAVRGPSWQPISAPAARVEEVGAPDEVEAVAARLAGALGSRMRWERADASLRSPLIPTQPLPHDPDARRLYSQGVRLLARWEPYEGLVLVQRALQREPEFVAGLTLMGDRLLSWDSPSMVAGALSDSDLLERGLPRVAQLPPDSPERQWIEALTPEATKNGETGERLKSLLAARPDDFELALQTAAFSPDFAQQLTALRALPPPLGADPRIDMREAALRVWAWDLSEASAVIDHGLAEARRRDDRLTISWFLGQRAVVEIKEGRTDDGEKSFLEAEREALAAGSSSFAGHLRGFRAYYLGVAGRLSAASRLLRQLLAGRPEIGEELARRQELLSDLAVTEANLGHAEALRELIVELKALPPSHASDICALELYFEERSSSPAHREEVFRREFASPGSKPGCKGEARRRLGWELLYQGRPADAATVLAETGPDFGPLYAHVMTDLGKAAEAYPNVQAKGRDELVTRTVFNEPAWHLNRALAICLLGLHELDAAARAVANMARFHRTWEDAQGRAVGLSLEAELALARRVVP